MAATHVLDAIDFWKVYALGVDVRRLTLEAQLTAVRAQEKYDACVHDLAAKYGFDPKAAQVRLDDQALTLTVLDDRTGGP